MPLRPSLQVPMSVQPIRAGYYHYTNNSFGTTTTLLTNGSLRVAPWYVPNACTITRIGAEVTAAGTVGSVIRLVIYSDDGAGYPALPLLDAGTIDGTLVAVQEKTVSLALAPGVYWVGMVAQGAPATAPTVRSSNSPAPIQLSMVGTTAPTANGQLIGYVDTTAASVLPSPFTTTVVGASIAPRVFVKA